MLEIPRIVMERIDPDEFRKACRKYRPADDLAFAIDDIVTVKRDFGRVVPGVVIGISPGVGGWVYSVVCPRSDGVLESLTFNATKMTKVVA